MKKTRYMGVVGILVFLAFNTANAELLVNPVSKSKLNNWEGSGHFGISITEYKVGSISPDIDRTFIGGTFAYGMNQSIDIYGTLSYTLESELENSTSDGSGYILGGGVRGKIPANFEVALHGYAQLLFIDEDYGNNLDGEETTLMIGVVAAKDLQNNIKLYGGVELNLISDMDIGTASADRDNFLGFRLGANFTMGNLLLNINTALIHETGVFLSASKAF